MDWSTWTPQLKTVEKMLQLRGYTGLTGIMHGVDPLLVCSARDTGNETVLVYFLAENKVGVRTLRRIQAECEASACKHAVLVTEDGLTPFAHKELDDPERVGSVVEVFKKKELAFCVVDHVLVPKHTLLSNAEKKTLLQKLGTKASCLPRIKESDPVVRFMRFPSNGVLKIQRNIGTCQEEYYRLIAP